MEEIRKEVRRSLKMELARFWIWEDVYYTYACKQCKAETGEGNLREAPKQPTLCPGSFCLSGGCGPYYDAEISHVLIRCTVRRRSSSGRG